MSAVPKFRCCVLLALLLMQGTVAQANVVIAGTRQVFPGSERELTVQLSNRGSTPSLVQAWVDDGDEKATPSSSKAPFLVTPVMSRLDPMKGQALRVLLTSGGLPQDRESLFWLNVLDVPSTDRARAGENHLQVAFRSRLKLLYRPQGLKGSAASAAEGLQWKLGERGGKQVLQASNASAFYVSVSSVSVTAGGRSFASDDSATIGPQSELEIPLKPSASPPPGVSGVDYVWVSDFGAAVRQSSSLGD
ncbi:fimbrial biogenesis chaperone [Pseudomonas knackmussii]|uniref:fimbrial biogenesis chaperone n=1 Tax=Pseudomonas knackmussii TaxID=65741 RepID=UPI003F4A5689